MGDILMDSLAANVADKRGGSCGNGSGNNSGCGNSDPGAVPYAANIWQTSVRNRNYRKAVWTGCHLQMTVMSIPVNSDIGSEIHEDTDQYIRVEQGSAMAKLKNCRGDENCYRLSQGDAVFVPAGTRHNVINIGRTPLKISTIYAPPHHKKGVIESMKPGDCSCS